MPNNGLPPNKWGWEKLYNIAVMTKWPASPFTGVLGLPWILLPRVILSIDYQYVSINLR